MTLFRTLAPWCLMCFSVACGGSMKSADPAAAPSGTDAAGAAAAEPAPLDQQTSDFEKAEADLQRALSEGNDGIESGDAFPTKPRIDEGDDGEEISSLGARDRCEMACKALASMKRSAEQVCELTGEDDIRCTKLRGRVERAKSTVYASCPACEAARP